VRDASVRGSVKHCNKYERQSRCEAVVALGRAEVALFEAAQVDDDALDGDAGVDDPEFEGVIAGGGDLEVAADPAGFVAHFGVPFAIGD